jgi:cobalt transporter subunit CbtB
MKSATVTTDTIARPAAKAGTRSIAATLAAALLGGVLIWGVGFSHVEAFHNAAHDTRHSNAFPCH